MVQSPSNRLKTYWPGRAAADAPAERSEPSASGWQDRLARCMSERPALTLATAAIIGLAVGWIVKRK